MPGHDTVLADMATLAIEHLERQLDVGVREREAGCGRFPLHFFHLVHLEECARFPHPASFLGPFLCLHLFLQLLVDVVRDELPVRLGFLGDSLALSAFAGFLGGTVVNSISLFGFLGGPSTAVDQKS